MKCEEIRFESSNGVDTVVSSVWISDIHTPKAVLQIVHGMCEHMGRYENFAQFMVQNGFIVCGHDLIGHGRTALTSDDLGFFSEKGGHLYLVDDVQKMRNIISETFPGLPHFLFGHSMGSFITRQYITKYSKGLHGYICSGTGGPMPVLNFAISYAKLQRKLKGSRTRGYAVNKLVFGSSYKKTGRVKSSNKTSEKASHSPHSWLSRDPAVWEAFSSDPKCNYVFTNAGFQDMFTLYRDVSSKSWAKSVPTDLPFLLISGDKDPVGGRGHGVKAVYDMLRIAGLKDLSIKLYKDARHELLNETNKSEVYGYLTEWMCERI